MPTPPKKAKKMPNYDVHAKHYFSCQTTLKKAKFLEFGLKNVNLATLLLSQREANLWRSAAMLLLRNKEVEQSAPRFRKLPLQTKGGHEWTANSPSLHNTRTVNLVLMQCQCHTDKSTVITRITSIDQKAADFRFARNLGSWIQFPGGEMPVLLPTDARDWCDLLSQFHWKPGLWSRSQQLLDVGAGTKKFRFLELEPDSEIWVPAP